MMKKMAKLLYSLSIYFDCTCAEDLKKSRMYDGIIQESKEVMNIVAEWNRGNLIEILPIEISSWGAINDCLNLLVIELIEGIKQLPNNSSIKIKFQISETPLNTKNVINPSRLMLYSENIYIDKFDNLNNFDNSGDLNALESHQNADISFSEEANTFNSKRSDQNTGNSFKKLAETLGKISRIILGKLFYYLSIFFDKKYYEYRRKSQKYDQIIGDMSRQIIAILDVVESWTSGNLRERI